MADTRKDKRAPLSLKVRFKSATLDEFVEQYSYDISRGGIFIKSKKPMKVGTLLKFEFQLKDESSLIHGVGRVVWRRDPEEGGPAPGMGIKFIKMDPDSRAFVQRIVDERENAPGTFDAGEDGPKKEEDFFPAGAPQQIDPEDRTQVRHASEFLAEALSESDGAEEAEAEAAAARARTEEIQREREAAERESRAAEERAKERDAEQAAARNDVAEEEEPESANDEADKKPAKTSDAPAAAAAEAKADKADKPNKADKADKPKAAAKADKPKAADKEKAKKPAAPKAAAPAPANEPGGNGMVIGLIIAILVAGGGYFLWQNQQTENPTETVNVEPETDLPPDSIDEPIDEPVEEPVEEPVVETATATVSANVGAEIWIGGEAVAATLEEPVSIDIPTEGVDVVARARGYRPQTLNATPGAELTFELEALPWVIRVTSVPDDSRISIGGQVVRSSERTYTEAPTEPITVAATRRGFLAANRDVTVAEFTAGEDAMTATITLTLQERRATSMTTMTTTMTTMTATMEAEPPVMEAVVMEADPVTEPAVMEAAPVVMEASTPIVMDAPVMEAATMEAAPPDTVPDNPF